MHTTVIYISCVRSAVKNNDYYYNYDDDDDENS